MRYAVWCEVWGGVTGSRASWLKEDGKVQVFETREAAQAEASSRLASTMGSPHRTANFSYTVEPYELEG